MTMDGFHLLCTESRVDALYCRGKSLEWHEFPFKVVRQVYNLGPHENSRVMINSCAIGWRPQLIIRRVRSVVLEDLYIGSITMGSVCVCVYSGVGGNSQRNEKMICSGEIGR